MKNSLLGNFRKATSGIVYGNFTLYFDMFLLISMPSRATPPAHHFVWGCVYYYYISVRFTVRTDDAGLSHMGELFSEERGMYTTPIRRPFIKNVRVPSRHSVQDNI